MSRKDEFPPSAYIALVGKRMLRALKQGYRPTRDISTAQLFALSDELRNAAHERRALTESKNEKFNGGVQHTTVTLDRAQLAWVVASIENYTEPQSCNGLTKKLTGLRDSLVGDVEEDESAPLLKDGAMVITQDSEGRFHFPDG